MANQCPITSTEPLRHQFTKPPVLVVGLPRSGSSFLSRVLSASSELYVFDDLYTRKTCLGYNNPLSLTDIELDELKIKLYWTLHARVKFNADLIPELTKSDAAKLTDSIFECFRSTSPSWADVHAELLSRLARLKGSEVWGWKCPGDIRALEALSDLFPGIRVIFLHRHPVDVLQSKKNVPSGDGDKESYHPFVQCLYWKTAWHLNHQFALNHPRQSFLLPFDKLVKRDSVIHDMCTFLEISPICYHGDSPNSSFKKSTRTPPTLCEIIIVKLTCKKAMKSLGYSLKTGWAKFGFVPLISQTFDFSRYYLQKSIKDKSQAATVREFLFSTFKK